MYEKLSTLDLEFMEHFYDPIELKEVLMPENIKSPHLWLEDDYIPVRLRNYQYAWQNYSYMYEYDDKLSAKQNFEKTKNAGICYNIGSRNTGKSWDFIQLDSIINMIYGAGKESCCGSATQAFLNKVLNPVLNLARNHPFFEIFKQSGKSEGIRGGNDISIHTKHGHIFYGKNEKIESNEPGTAFHGLHYDLLQFEEIHYASEAGEEKRIDSGNSIGSIERFSGIPDVRVGSPLGKILYSEKNKKLICRLPQSIREDWTEEAKQERIEKYNGESSLAFKLNCLGQIIEGAEGYWDIERIRKKCLDKTRKIKQFDIDKKRFANFRSYIIIDRVPAEQIFVAADIGAGARPTEIIIIFYTNKKYKLVYNITLNKLTSREQASIFAYIYEKLGSCFIALDTTTDYGILDYLEKDFKIPKKHLLGVDLRKNIDIDFEKNDRGRLVRNKAGKPIIKQMIAIDWAMNRLEHLFYEALMNIPLDNKLFKEFGGFKMIQSGLRKSYGSSTTDDYHQSIPKNEVITCKINGNLVCNKIEDIYNRTQNILVPTYNQGNMVWQSGKIFREKNKTNKILEFHFKPSSNLRVTEGHSTLVWNSKKMQLEEKLAKDVKIGDLMLSVRNLNLPEIKKYLYTNIHFFYEKKHIEVKKKLKIDEKFAYLMGWCCAEGSQSGNGAYVLSLGLKDPAEQIQKTIFDVFGIKSRIDIRPPRVSIVLGGGRKLAEFIALQIGRLAKNKKVPEIILNSKESVQTAFFKGLIEGDGNKEGKLTSISRRVANGYYTSLIGRNKRCSFNIVLNRFNNYEYYIKDGNRIGYYDNIPYKALPYDYIGESKTLNRNKIKNANYKFTPKSQRNKEILKLVKDFNFIEVKKIKSYQYDDYVYDVEVEGNHNFVAGVGNVVVHNSFQIFAICQWQYEFETLINKNNTDQSSCLGYI